MERILASLPAQANHDHRIIVGREHNEDAAILRFPPGKALVQTVDFFTPIVNDPHAFGRIAAVNALSDVYAMGGEPWCALNIVCFPVKDLPRSILQAIIQGGYDALCEAGAVLAGGHSVEDSEIKFGLSVTGVIEPGTHTSNAALCVGDQLLLTKPLGIGVLATALKAKWEGAETLEALLCRWAGHLNAAAGSVLRTMGLKAATDVTGFGLGGHLLEMTVASKKTIRLWANKVPVIEMALELAEMGLIPAGSHANKKYCLAKTRIDPAVPASRVDIIFDAQTSGGLILAVPESALSEAVSRLQDAGEFVSHIGEVVTEEAISIHISQD